MIVYIEYAILDNLIIDFLIIYLTASALHTKYTKSNVILCLIEGIVFALISPFITLNTYLLVAIKILYSLIMVFSLKRYITLKEFLVTYFVFISFTFMLGGVCFAFLSMLNIPYNQNGIVLNGYALPISIFVLLAFIYICIMVKFIRYFCRHQKQSISTYDVVLTVNAKNYYIRGFLDSGNQLKDGDKPISVISFACFCKIFKSFPFDKLLLDNVNSQDLKNAHYICVTTANKTSNMLVFEVDQLKICHDDINITKSNVKIGVSKNNFGSFECLLNDALL